MIGVGVIGYGYWGPNLVRVFHECEGSRVAAVCDRDPSTLEACAKRFPAVRCHAQADSLFEEADVDLVAVATPLSSHFDLARRAIQAGKHVLVEKPLTRTAAQAEELIDLARRRGVLLAVDHTYIFTPAVSKMKELIEQGRLGRMNYIDSVRINLGLIQHEVDVVWDLAPHDLSILDHLVGLVPKRIVATGASHLSGGQVDVAYLHLDYGGGLIANVHVNWLSPVKVRRMIFGGDRRMLIYDELSSNEKVRVYESRAVPVSHDGSENAQALYRVDYRVGDIWTPHLPPREALAVEAEHLVAAIEKGERLRADGAAGLRVVQVLEACERSLQADGALKRQCLSEPSVRGSGLHLDQEPRATIPLARPSLGRRELARVADVLASGWVTQGPVTAEFEEVIARYLGTEHAVAVSSATAALHVALRVLDVGPGDEVIVPSLTFIATANAIRYCGATPVFADVDPRTFNLDPDSVAHRLSKRTKVILAVHQFGLPADLCALRGLGRRASCTLVEDAACALGSRYQGRLVGSDSELACFSFHPRKIITTGEGGIIVTNNATWADRLRRLRHHGMDKTDWQRHQFPFPMRESYVEVGFNYRMSDIAAAVGLAQLERIDAFIKERVRLAAGYNDAFADHPFLRVPRCPYDARSNHQTYAVCVTENSPIGSDGLVRYLRGQGIAAKAGLACIHLEPCYRDRYPTPMLPHSESLAQRMLLLPIFPGMDEAAQRRVITTLFAAFDGRSKSASKTDVAYDGRLADAQLPMTHLRVPRRLNA